MFLCRDDYYNDSDENHNLAECIIAKNRHGETRTVELQWLPEYTTFLVHRPEAHRILTRNGAM